jgi:hypothetical protein
MALQKEIGNRWGIAMVQGNLAYIDYREGNYPHAIELSRDYLSTMRDLRRLSQLADGVCLSALLCAETDELEKAVRLLSAAETAMAELGALWDPLNEAEKTALSERLQAKLGTSRFQALWDEGQAMSLEEAAEYALEERTYA